MSNPIDPYTLGLLVMFGSAGLGLLGGGLLGWWTRFEWGVACGLLCFAAGGLGSAARVAWFVEWQSVLVAAAQPSSCEEIQVGEGRKPWVRIDHYTVKAANGEPLDLRLPFVSGRCAAGTLPPPRRLRYALGDVADAGAGPVNAIPEDDPQQPWAVVGVLSAFGGFGLLAGLFFLSLAWPRRPAPRLQAPPLPAWRSRMGTGLTVAGNLTVFAAAGWAGFADVSAERSTAIVFGGVALACAAFMAASALLRKLSVPAALILLIVGGGCGLAAWAVTALT